MEIENFKRWHWILISLIVGASIGGVMVFYGPDVDAYAKQSMNMASFEDLVINHNYDGVALPLNVRVYPLSEIDDAVVGSVVRYEREDLANPRSEIKPVMSPFLFSIRAPYPNAYRGNERVGPPEAFKSNLDYLQKLSAKFPDAKIQYQFAWWTKPKAMMGLWIAGSLVMIGGIWPTVLNLMTGAGLAPKREPKADRRRYAEEVVEKKRTEMTAAEKDQLAALEAKLQSSVADFLSNENDPDDATAGRQGTSPVKKLETAPLEPPPAAKPEEKEEIKYGGTYYPTITRVKKKTDE